MRVILQLAVGLAAFYIILAGGFCLLADVAGAQEILPMNAPAIQTKAIHTLTAEERSTILIEDIWRPPELERVKVGAAVSRFAKGVPIEPYGFQAYVAQDAIGSWRGGYEAVAYGGL